MLPVVRFGADADDARTLGAAQRLRRRQGVERQPSALAVEHVVEPRPFARRERDELVAGREPDVPRRGVVGEQEPALAVRRGDPFIDRSQDARELLARLVQGELRPRPLGDRGEVVPDRPREQHLAVAPAVRRVAVDGDPPEQLAAPDERDEGERPDALLAHGPLERGLVAGVADVLDEDRLGVVVFRLPRRAPFGVRAVAAGEAAPGAEAEHALVVGEQDRGAIRARGFEERVERRLEHLVQSLRARDRVGEAVDGVEVAQPPAQFLALAHVAGRPEHETELARLVVDGGAVHLEPRVASAGAADPDGHGVDVGAGGDLVPGLGGQPPVVGMEQLDDRDAGEVGRLPAEFRPRRGRVDDRAGQVAERDEVVRALDDEPPDGVVNALGSHSARLGPAARGSAPSPVFVARRSLHDPRPNGQRRGRGRGVATR